MALYIAGLKEVVKNLRATPRGLQTEVWAHRVNDNAVGIYTMPAGEDTRFMYDHHGAVFIGCWSAERPYKSLFLPEGERTSHTDSVQRAVKRAISRGWL